MPIKRPEQAVILAGGLGTRLRPLTDHTPKPMVLVNHQPFLLYILLHLKQQGFKRIVLLLGYLAESVKHYFQDGSQWDLQIEYSVSAVENDTGTRLRIAKPLLEDYFLLLYCDNYWPMHFEKMWAHYLASNCLAQVTVYQNKDNYTKHNLIVDENDHVILYDKTRQASGLSGVDIGFIILNKSVLNLLPENENISFEKIVYPALIKEKQLSAFLTDHRYYSVGSLERLAQVNAFFQQPKTIFLDRDGVLNKKAPKAEYVKNWSQWSWLPGALEALTLLKQHQYRVILISNQAGIARGEMTEQDLQILHEHMLTDVKKAGGEINKIYYCPHGWDSTCACRKPKPGLLFQAQKEFDLDLSKIYFIGDDERDAEAAKAADCPWVLVNEEKNLLSVVKELILKN